MTTTHPPSVHEQITEPVYKVLTEFMDKCSDDPETREAMLSSLTLSFWQLASRGVMRQTPSIILVNASNEQGQDHILKAVRKLCNEGKVEEQQNTEAMKRAPDAMLKAALTEQQIRANPASAHCKSCWPEIYNKERVVGFGQGNVSDYARAWHPQLGLITDKKNSIVLKLNGESDWETFRHDLHNEPQKLKSPAGISTELDLLVKSLTLNGALEAERCDHELVDAVLELGIPLFFLPHTTSKPINIPNYPALSYFALKLDTTANMLPCSAPLVPQDKWCSYYGDWIFQRLSRLPQNYRFCILETVHQLQIACETLVLYSGPANGESTPDTRALARNLFTTVLRNTALSLAFLAWHGHGIELSCSLRTARKVLKVLREDGGSVSRRDVQRSVGFNTAAKRDEVLAQLENQGLVTLDDNLVSATHMHEFIANIRQQLPMATKTSDPS
ncbi:hypothetical protein HW115_17865 [Verrucomicrobiaceae bacterium N1E253]|uniref:Uncharacterized protein n=1 Tax=Oceaniferula marina TaxID=2748318 RepID=A0A851GK05_9BACT|nr:hypothetical protein [Oceaniferula marina]NWK57489.1 hypothetical protein [Oceaniferula marina]